MFYINIVCIIAVVYDNCSVKLCLTQVYLFFGSWRRSCYFLIVNFVICKIGTKAFFRVLYDLL